MLMSYFKTIKKKKNIIIMLYTYHFNVVISQVKRGTKAFENPWKGEMLRKIQNGQIRYLW